MLKCWLPGLPTGSFIGKENTSRIQYPARDKIDAPTSLRQTEAYSIQDAISPRVVQRFKTCGQAIHGSPPIELQHEIDVLDDNCWNFRALDQIEKYRPDFCFLFVNSAFLTCAAHFIAQHDIRTGSL